MHTHRVRNFPARPQAARCPSRLSRCRGDLLFAPPAQKDFADGFWFDMHIAPATINTTE